MSCVGHPRLQHSIRLSSPGHVTLDFSCSSSSMSLGGSEHLTRQLASPLKPSSRLCYVKHLITVGLTLLVQ